MVVKRNKLTISVYILALAGGNYYVGQAKHPTRRIKEHFDGCGSSWTRTHYPIEIVKVLDSKSKNWRVALEMEKAITHELMVIHGWEKVRGGAYSASDYKGTPVAFRTEK